MKNVFIIMFVNRYSLNAAVNVSKWAKVSDLRKENMRICESNTSCITNLENLKEKYET